MTLFFVTWSKMYKFSAILLLLPMAVLFVGTVRIGSVCTSQPTAVATNTASAGCGKGSATTQCGEMRAATKCCGSAACHQSKDQPKPKHACPCCLECPLCAPVTLSPVFRLEVARHERTIEYAVMLNNDLSDYSEQHWKPPNLSWLT